MATLQTARVHTMSHRARREPSRWLHRFAVLTVAATFVLIIAGGLVTSTGSALAVPDWPLSFGMLMPPMVGGIFYEHGHRMIAGLVTILTLVLALWLARQEPRRWVRGLGFIAFATVIAQAVLGGLTVLLLLPPAIAIAHACLAQTFFCLTIVIALVTSPGWIAGEARSHAGGMTGSHSVHARELAGRAVPWLAVAALGAIYIQLLLGAWMRHTNAGLAIPDFPLAFGRLVPDRWSPEITAHYAHRAWAIAVLALGLGLVAAVFRHRVSEPDKTRSAALLGALLPLQVGLGGLSVLSGKQVALTTTHVATGAAILGTTLVLGMRLWRPIFEKRSALSGRWQPRA